MVSIIDSLTKNPSLLALAALGIGLFIFRDKISGFFSDITGGAQGAAQIAETGGILGANLQSNLVGIQDILSGKILEGIQLPKIEIPSFEFPTFQFPEIKLPEIFTGTTLTETGAAIARAGDRDRIFPEPTPEVQGPIAPIDPSRPTTLADFIPKMIEAIIPTTVQTTIPDQQFIGGGPSFIGGTVSEIPLERQSLSDIINNLGVTASQAASLRAEAIGFTPAEQIFLQAGQEISPLGDLGPQVSDPAFQGLTPEEIALRLTGGLISNF